MKQDLKPMSIFFRVIAVIAIGAAIGVTIFFIYTLMLRTDYKETMLEVNDKVVKYEDSAMIRQGGESLPASPAVVNWYDSFLLSSNTVVYSRDAAEQNEKTIWLILGDSSLAFTGVENDSAIHILWCTPGGEKSFRVRSTTSFNQMEAYFKNYKRRESN